MITRDGHYFACTRVLYSCLLVSHHVLAYHNKGDYVIVIIVAVLYQSSRDQDENEHKNCSVNFRFIIPFVCIYDVMWI